MIYFLTLLSLYIWPFGQLLSCKLSFFSTPIYLLDISMFSLFVSLLLSKHRKKIFFTPLTKPFFCFLFVASLSLLISLPNRLFQDNLLAVFYLLRLLIYPSLYFAIRFLGIKQVSVPLRLSIVVFLLIGATQYVFFPDMRFLKFVGFDDHYFRLIGSLYDPNYYGAVLAGLSIFLITRKKYLLSLPLLLMLALTFSRASFLAFGVGLITLLISQKNIRILLLLGVLGLLIFLTPKPFGEGVNLLRTFSIYSRISSWNQGLDLYSQKPLLGWGYNTLRSINGQLFQIDNSYIVVLATTGIAGFAAFLYLLQLQIKNTQNYAVRMLLLVILIHSFFNNSLFYIWISSFFWAALALGEAKTKE